MMTRCIDRAIVRTFLLVVLLAGALGCDSGAGDALPATPTMMLPANGATDQANALELQWNPSSGAETYHVEVSSDARFSNLDVDEQGINNPFFAIKGLHLGETYHWHVRAHNEAGFSDWSATWRFTPTFVAVVPGVPGLKFPVSDATSLSSPVTFEWTASTGSRTYHLQISQEPTFLRRDADIEDVNRTSKTVFELEQGYTYYWRVRAQNPAGFSNWSVVRKFVMSRG